jgi:hypothetical protein
VGESIPRFNRRGSDLAIQGSNNTLICLGENFVDPLRSQNGLIDLVVGRGNTTGVNSSRQTENTRGYYETDKRTPNPAEGERSLLNDSARIAIFMNARSDATTESMMSYWRGIGAIGATKSAPDGSMAMTKADNIRLIANDSIFLLRDSSAGSEGLIIDSSGNVQMRGSKIYLGRSSATEPFIKYSAYKDTVDAISSAIDEICTALNAFAPALAISAKLKGILVTKNAQAKSSVIFGE